MSNKRVLLVCYYFPPLGGAGVGRPLALYKQLNEFGWDCHILTVKPVAYRVFEPELLDDLPKDNIYRAGSYDPQRLMYLLGIRKVKGSLINQSKPASNKFFPDSKIGWVRSAIKFGRTLLGNRKYDAIISTSPPVSAHLVAQSLAGEFSIPWVADFRDYWTTVPIEKTYHSDNEKIKKGNKLLSQIIEKSSTKTAINKSIGDYVKADHIVYNSYDRDHAKLWSQPETDKYYIGILGSINNMCPVEPLLQAISKLKEDNQSLYKLIKLVQVGSVDKNWLLIQLKKYGLTDITEINGIQNRAATIELLSKTSLMYLGLKSKDEIGISTGRIYTILSSGRPVLAYAHPDGELAKLVNSTSNGFVFNDKNNDKAVAYLKEQIDSFREKEGTISLLPDYALPYASDKIAAQFAEILNQL